jgi:general stress protein YciG
MGFAKLSLEESREVSRKGGKRANALGRAYKWTSETAKLAGRKGGSISRRRRKGGETR